MERWSKNPKIARLIANDPIDELKYSKIKILRPDNLDDNYRLRDREGMKKLIPKKVFQDIINQIN